MHRERDIEKRYREIVRNMYIWRLERESIKELTIWYGYVYSYVLVDTNNIYKHTGRNEVNKQKKKARMRKGRTRIN